MTTNQQIERMAEAISNLDLPCMVDGQIVRVNPIYWKLIAQAAYDASDARLVPMLVEALRDLLYVFGTNDNNDPLPLDESKTLGCIVKGYKALAQLPEEYR